jgi:hypothetical protein
MVEQQNIGWQLVGGDGEAQEVLSMAGANNRLYCITARPDADGWHEVQWREATTQHAAWRRMGKVQRPAALAAISDNLYVVTTLGGVWVRHV